MLRLFRQYLLCGWFTIVIALATAATAAACDIPVFRYALERWSANGVEDGYELLVFHDSKGTGKLSYEDNRLLVSIETLSSEPVPMVNLQVRRIDLSEKLSPLVAPIWKREAKPSKTKQSPAGKTDDGENKPPTPWLVLRYPLSNQETPSAWSGPLNSKNVAALLQSPARQELAKRLMTGDSIVWLVLESGDKKTDDAACEKLASELSKLEKSIKLPEKILLQIAALERLRQRNATNRAKENPATTKSDSKSASQNSEKPESSTKEISTKESEAEEFDFKSLDRSSRLMSNIPLRISFSILRVCRTDAAEQAFVSMLLQGDQVLQESGQPIVFPVFGRGRTLDAMLFEHWQREHLNDAASFLCSACSCLVKELNPGFDLLIAADWESLVEDRQPRLFVWPPKAVDKATSPIQPVKTTTVDSPNNAVNPKLEKPESSVK